MPSQRSWLPRCLVGCVACGEPKAAADPYEELPVSPSRPLQSSQANNAGPFSPNAHSTDLPLLNQATTPAMKGPDAKIPDASTPLSSPVIGTTPHPASPEPFGSAAAGSHEHDLRMVQQAPFSNPLHPPSDPASPTTSSTLPEKSGSLRQMYGRPKPVEDHASPSAAAASSFTGARATSPAFRSSEGSSSVSTYLQQQQQQQQQVEVQEAGSPRVYMQPGSPFGAGPSPLTSAAPSAAAATAEPAGAAGNAPLTPTAAAVAARQQAVFSFAPAATAVGPYLPPIRTSRAPVDPFSNPNFQASLANLPPPLPDSPPSGDPLLLSIQSAPANTYINAMNALYPRPSAAGQVHDLDTIVDSPAHTKDDAALLDPGIASIGPPGRVYRSISYQPYRRAGDDGLRDFRQRLRPLRTPRKHLLSDPCPSPKAFRSASNVLRPSEAVARRFSMERYGGSFEMPGATGAVGGGRDRNGFAPPGAAAATTAVTAAAAAHAAPMDGVTGPEGLASARLGDGGGGRGVNEVGSHVSSSSSVRIKTAMLPSSEGNDSTVRSDYFLPSSWNTAQEGDPFQSRTASERSSEELGHGRAVAGDGKVFTGGVKRGGSDLALFDLQGDDGLGRDDEGPSAGDADGGMEAIDRMDSEKLTAELASAAALFSRCGYAGGQGAKAAAAAGGGGGGDPAGGDRSWGRGQSGGIGDDEVGSFGMRDMVGAEGGWGSQAASSHVGYENDCAPGIGRDQYRGAYGKGKDEPVVGHRQPFGATAASIEAARAKAAAEVGAVFSGRVGEGGGLGRGYAAQEPMHVDIGAGGGQQAPLQQQQDRKAGGYMLRYGVDQQGRVVFGGNHSVAEGQ